MTAREDVLARLDRAAPELRAHAVKELWLFGSAAREELRPDSDIDILVDFASPVTLFEFARLRRHLAFLLGRPVDLVTRDALKPQLREQILREAVRAALENPNLRLQDIAEAIDRIFDYTASHSLESFGFDRMAVDAVVRNLEVIGEAARHVDAATTARLADIPWQDMRDLRNLLIHEYFGVSVPIIWETVSRDLRPVREAIRRDLERS